MFANLAEIQSFIQAFETCRLSKSSWTHEAHLVAGLWYLTHHSPDDALTILRKRIRDYNEATGTENSDVSGYHETITRLFLRGIAGQIAARPDDSLVDSVARLRESPMADKNWPLSYYTRERLFSVEARRSWMEPDLPQPLATSDAPAASEKSAPNPYPASFNLERNHYVTKWMRAHMACGQDLGLTRSMKRQMPKSDFPPDSCAFVALCEPKPSPDLGRPAGKPLVLRFWSEADVNPNKCPLILCALCRI